MCANKSCNQRSALFPGHHCALLGLVIVTPANSTRALPPMWLHACQPRLRGHILGMLLLVSLWAFVIEVLQHSGRLRDILRVFVPTQHKVVVKPVLERLVPVIIGHEKKQTGKELFLRLFWSILLGLRNKLASATIFICVLFPKLHHPILDECRMVPRLPAVCFDRLNLCGEQLVVLIA